MDRNEKPQAINLGQSLDVESMNRNVIDINTQSAKSQSVIGKSSPIITVSATSKDEMLEIAKMLREQRKRRDDAALRLPPMRCGCHDPLRCSCYSKRGAR
jgi:regulatory protein YycH of two-component signal transduction system YycFG